ncbi:MAG: HAMP domain-containing histidine kinase [Victivallales bacterium]|nr:HAMP domain-containing histidine kinase [Victivallales bacterium]
MRLGQSTLWWLALTLSALLLGGASLLLLQRERGRLQDALGEAERSQVQTVAERLAAAVYLTQDQLGTALANGAWEDLDALERISPLVRNVFVFDPEAHMLRQPHPHNPASTEENGFLRRYETLFADRHLWQQILAPANASTPRESPSLRRTTYAVGGPKVRGFWLPWSSDNRLHFIGGIQLAEGGPVYGVEIEMVSLVARLSIKPVESGSYYATRRSRSIARKLPPLALLDGTDRALLVTDGVPEEQAGTPDFRYPVGLPLPHWQLAVYRRPDATRGVSSLATAATALVIIMVIAIVGGGATLFADARRSRRDARRRTTFVANVSHELKTPLTSIRMYAELLRDDRVPDQQRRQRFLDTMVQEGERLTRLIDNVLDLGRLEQARRNYNPRPIDLADCLRAILEVEARRLKTAGLELTTEIPDQLPTVTDPDAVRQVVLNLLENASKYAAAGGCAHVSLARAAGVARLTVQDAGPGIPPGCRERIFGMFERLDDSLEGKAGSGLGLAIARGLARGLGGDLVCTEATGPGACFTLTLPLKDTP